MGLTFQAGPTGEYLPVEVSDQRQNTNYDEVNTYQIVKYLGENHDNDTEYQTGNTHP
jgi:hypothetical protein